MKALDHTSYYQRANRRAVSASKYFATARQHREAHQKYKYLFDKWENIIYSPEAIILTLVFVVSCPVEIMVSYEMYREMLGNYSGDPSPVLIWLMGFFVVGMAAWVSHMLSLKLSHSIRRLEIFSLQNNQPGLLEVEAIETINKISRKQFTRGVIFFILLIIVVGAISWQRSLLTVAATGQDTISLLDKLLPIVVVIIEVFTGIYAAYFIRFFHLRFLRKSTRKAFEKYADKGAAETQMSYILFTRAKEAEEKFELSNDIKDVLYRVTFLSEGDDHYTDEIKISQCKLIVVDQADRPVPKVKVVGLQNQSKLTIPTFTDNEGIAFLHWNLEHPLEAIDIGGQIFEGPYFRNSTYKQEIATQQQLIT